MPGGSTTPGPPASTHATTSAVASSSSTSPSQTGRAPAWRPNADGDTTMTFDRSHASRQSLTLTRAADGEADLSLATWAAWSTSGCLATLPQQHPRQTVIVAWSGAVR